MHVPPVGYSQRPQRRSSAAPVEKGPLLATEAATRPLIERNQDARYRATAALQRVAFRLKRKVGYETEDKPFDTLLRQKALVMCGLSMLGLLAVVFLDAIPHQQGLTPKEGGPTVFNQTGDKLYLLALQTVITVSSLICVVLIMQYYRLKLLLKRREWSGFDIQDQHAHESERDRAVRLRETKRLGESYSFWASNWFLASFMFEMFVHMFHPIVFLSNQTGLFELTKIVTLLRLYHWIRVIHCSTTAYMDRFEIIGQDEFSSIRVDTEFTLKSLLQRHVSSSLAVWALFTIAVGGFSMFLVEKDSKEDEWAGDLLNTFWFAFVTATTIGYGDYYPTTFPGRIIAVIIGLNGFFLITVFTAELVNALKPDRTERHINTYLASRKADRIYEHSAAKLIQAIWRTKRMQKRTGHPTFHRSNVVLDAVKQLQALRRMIGEKGAGDGAGDVVLEDALDELCQQANDLGLQVQAQRDALLGIHKKVYRQLRTVHDKVRESVKGRPQAPPQRRPPLQPHAGSETGSVVPFYD